MDDGAPTWTRWLGLTLGFEALVLFETSGRGWSSRPLVWWAVTAVLAVGVVRVTSRPRRARRWWPVAVAVGPLVLLVSGLLGAITTTTGPVLPSEPSGSGLVTSPAWVVTSTNWAYLRDPPVLLLPSLVALGLRWPDAARWASRRWGPAAPRVAGGAGGAAIVAWLAMPRAVFDHVPLVAVSAVIPVVVALGRGVTRPWARWVGVGVGLGYPIALVVLDGLEVEGGLYPSVELDLPVHPTAEALALVLVGWAVAAITIRVRERLTSGRRT